MNKFNDLIIDQMTYGGKKYSLNKEREATDVLFQVFGANWLYGTMGKYCFRFKNLARERDLLKIACYVFILWLKRGYHVKPEGLNNDVLDTTVESKQHYFSEFVNRVNQAKTSDDDNLIYVSDVKSDDDIVEENRNMIFNTLAEWAKIDVWNLVREAQLFSIYLHCYEIWKLKYEGAQVHDTDTANTR